MRRGILFAAAVASLAIAAGYFAARRIAQHAPATSVEHAAAHFHEHKEKFLSCRGTPSAVVKEISDLFERKSEFVHLAGLARIPVGQQNESQEATSLHYILNGEVCRGPFCRAHLFQTPAEPEAPGYKCDYVLSFYITTGSTAKKAMDVVRRYSDEYRPDCILYFRDFCF